MRHLVHLGQGKTVSVDRPDFIDPTVAKPRATIAAVKLRSLRRLKPVYVAPKLTGPVRFVPGPLLAMRDGQCRWPLAGDLYCGARAVAGKSWCEHHDALAHGRLVGEAAE